MAHGNVVVKVLSYKPEVAGSRLHEENKLFSIYSILPAILDHWVYSASNRNEYQKQKQYVSGE
jgi:hypothetical protein